MIRGDQRIHSAVRPPFEHLSKATWQGRDDAGHDDEADAVADAAAGDLLTDPHQEQVPPTG
jgi:hypothetical protein